VRGKLIGLVMFLALGTGMLLFMRFAIYAVTMYRF
jgi:hypothetical protein